MIYTVAGRRHKACDRGHADGADGGRAREHVKITPPERGTSLRLADEKANIAYNSFGRAPLLGDLLVATPRADTTTRKVYLPYNILRNFM